jgi:16S rRNA (guanine527-N7)-methyltransferase
LSELGPRAQDQLERYLRELGTWGQRMNLVGSLERADLEVHVADALAAADHLPPGIALADLGSGAGFPGVPLAIARPDVRVSLVEVREKRAHFLRHVVRVLGLQATVRCERFERIAPGAFDVVCLRAVGQAEDVLPQAAGWASPAGEIWLWTRLEAHEAPAAVTTTIELGNRGRVLRFPRSGFPVEQ